MGKMQDEISNDKSGTLDTRKPIHITGGLEDLKFRESSNYDITFIDPQLRFPAIKFQNFLQPW